MTNVNRQPEPIAYTVNDACRVLGLGRTFLYQMINDGRLEARKIGKRTLITAVSLHRLVDGG
jgi:excisionase family DNA binding protein